MAPFIPAVAKLLHSFLALVALSTPLPARSDAEKAVHRLDIRLIKHNATAVCNESAWLSLGDMVFASKKESAFVYCRSSELNCDKIFFPSYHAVAK